MLKQTQRLWNLAPLLLCIGLIQACSEFEIVEPVNNEVFLDTLPNELAFTFSNEPPNSIMLNGVNVLNYFALSDGSGSADINQLEAFLKQGVNNFAVGPPITGARIEFTVDTLGPRVIIESVSGEEKLEIQGRVEDPSGVQSLSVNGLNANLRDQQFDIVVDAHSHYEFIAYDLDNRMSSTVYNARNTPNEEPAVADCKGLLPIAESIGVMLAVCSTG